MSQRPTSQYHGGEEAGKAGGGSARTWLVVGIGALCATLLAGLFALLFWAPDGPASSAPHSGAEVSHAAGSPLTDVPPAEAPRTVPGTVWARSSRAQAPRRAQQGAAASGAPDGSLRLAQGSARGRSGGEWVVVRPELPAARQEASLDAGARARASDGAAEEGTWQDPVNQQVLGPPSWMTQVSAEEQQRIDLAQQTVQPVEEPPEIVLRHQSMELAHDVVHACFEPYAPYGQFAVYYDVAAAGGQAHFTQVYLAHVERMDDPEVADCIIATLLAQQFPSDENTQVQVGLPFIFDN